MAGWQSAQIAASAAKNLISIQSCFGNGTERGGAGFQNEL
jgi:hypothetical protein